MRTLGGAGHEHAQAVAVRRDGTMVVATLIGVPSEPSEPQRLGLVHLDAEGRVVSAREHPFGRGELHLPLTSLHASPLGNVLLLVEGLCELAPDCPDLGRGPIRGLTLLSLTPAGDLVWQVALPGQLASDVGVDGAGSAVVAFRNFEEVTLRKVRSDGQTTWERRLTSPAGGYLALDPQGNIVIGAGLGVTKLAPDGGLLWERVITGGDTSDHGSIWAIGTSARGTVVVAGHHGAELSLGDHRVRPPPGSRGVFLAVLEADGTTRSLGSAGRWDSAAGIAPSVEMEVHPEGWLALLVPAECGFRVERWGLDGARIWRRELAPASCTAGRLDATDLDIAPSRAIVVSGALYTATDFGGGLVSPDGNTDGWVLSLAP